MENEIAVAKLEELYDELGWDYAPDYSIALQTGIKALERNIPLNPILNFLPDSDGHYRYDGDASFTVMQCRKCKNRIRLAKKHDKYCAKCGQAIDWTRIDKIQQRKEGD